MPFGSERPRHGPKLLGICLQLTQVGAPLVGGLCVCGRRGDQGGRDHRADAKGAGARGGGGAAAPFGLGQQSHEEARLARGDPRGPETYEGGFGNVIRDGDGNFDACLQGLGQGAGIERFGTDGYRPGHGAVGRFAAVGGEGGAQFPGEIIETSRVGLLFPVEVDGQTAPEDHVTVAADQYLEAVRGDV